MRATLILVVVIVALVTPVQANHIAGHYGGVPAVQPAPLPWRYEQPPALRRGPTYVIPAPPTYVAPPQPIYVVPAPPAAPPQSGRYKGLNVCQTMRCD